MINLKNISRRYAKNFSLLALMLCVCAEVPEYCGEGSYDFNNQFCFNNKAYDKCGGGEYNPDMYFCSKDTLYELCGGKKYDPVKQKCENGEAVQIDTTKVITTFTVFYYGNGQNSGAVPEDLNSPYDSNSVVTVLDEGTLLKNGHNFSGWNMEAKETAVRIGVGERFNINANTKLYAVWTDTSVTTFKLTVKNGTGGGDFKAGETVAITAEVAPAGYQFENWTTTQSGVIFKNEDSVKTTFTMPASAVTVTANWTAIIYTITYNLDDGANHASNPSSYKVEDATITLEPPTRTGYTFEGWYNNKDFDGDSVTSIPANSTGNKEYWAKWELKKYAVTFDANGGEVTPESNTTGEDWKLSSLPTPTKNGYNFNGWFTEANSGTAVDTSKVYDENTTVYAQWTIIKYVITFDANGGEVTPESNITGEDWKLSSLPTPTKNGYNFNGWFTEANSGTAVDTSKVYDENTTIYAQWTATPYTIIYNLDGGANHASNPASYTVESPAITFNTPTKTGYTFDGWYDNQDFNGNPIPSIPHGSTGNKEYWVRWINSIVDTRDNKTYGIVTIGSQIWMAENLNYEPQNGSHCNNDNTEYCANYGRLYTWDAARTACPEGWHLPHSAEWDTLMIAVGGIETNGSWNGAGIKLKSQTGWNDNYYDGNPNGTDEYGFSALPGGSRAAGGYYNTAGFDGYWWSTGIYDSQRAWYRLMSSSGIVFKKYDYMNCELSVRCLRD